MIVINALAAVLHLFANAVNDMWGWMYFLLREALTVLPVAALHHPLAALLIGLPVLTVALLGLFAASARTR